MADTYLDLKPKYNNDMQHTTYISKLDHRDKSNNNAVLKNILSLCQAKRNKRGCHSDLTMRSAGLKYTGDDGTARCEQCEFQKSDWTADMQPFIIHSISSPGCPFVQAVKSMKPSYSSSSSNTSSYSASIFSSSSSSSLLPKSSSSPSTAIIRSASVSNENENPSKRQKTEGNNETFCLNSLFETDTTQQIRRRTFSHWPHRVTPSQAQMMEAGFFNCNVGDRVICIYCNLICQQWTPHTDDPSEVHKTLSPNCIYVKSNLIRRGPGSILIVNENTAGVTSGNRLTTSNNLEQFRCNEFVHTAACNPAYTELPKRTASFTSWLTENLPSVDDLVRAGFYYTGTKNIVTCFYCNGSLQNWGPNDNPTIEHARWFPHCAYARQLCGDELYRKIQESKRAHQERAKANEMKQTTGTSSTTNTSANSNSRLLLIPDESTLSRLVAARLDLPVSQNLLNKNFKLSIIKRCWEDQLRLKQDDFTTDSDLYMACVILQKQIEHIDGKKENIVIPSIKMKKLREDAERKRAEELAGTSSLHTQSAASSLSNNTDVEMTTSSQSATNESTSSNESTSRAITTKNQEETKLMKPSTSSTIESANESSPTNPCVLCLSEEKRLACIPCGHLATCVPCGHSLRSCPICRREIDAFVRIYV